MSEINEVKPQLNGVEGGGEMFPIPIDVLEMQALVKRHRTQYPNEPISGWVSVNEILNLISNNDANGVRIYFGRHDKNDKDYPDMLTVFLVATHDTSSAPTLENSIDVVSTTASSAGATFYVGLGDDRIPLCPPKCSVTSSIVTQG